MLPLDVSTIAIVTIGAAVVFQFWLVKYNQRRLMDKLRELEHKLDSRMPPRSKNRAPVKRLESVSEDAAQVTPTAPGTGAGASSDATSAAVPALRDGVRRPEETRLPGDVTRTR